ncbi:hypothetical protein KCU62_g287, partial [Aureobasidium sp. EXF-3399]
LTTPSLPAIPALASPAPLTGGALTFYQKMEMKKRRAAAGIYGGEADVDAPSGMPVAPRRESIFSFPGNDNRSPSPAASMTSTHSRANGGPPGPHATLGRRIVGPHAQQNNGSAHGPSPTTGDAGQPRANGTTQHVAPRTNGNAAVPIVDPARAVPVARADAPIAPTAPAAMRTAFVAPPVTATNGNGAPDGRDEIIRKLQRQVQYFQGQLNDRRNGPGSTAQTRPAHGSSNAGNDNRLKKVLEALKDYCVDHRACNDCGINFNAQFRGIVEHIEDDRLILKCGKCDSEKCDLFAVAENPRRRIVHFRGCQRDGTFAQGGEGCLSSSYNYYQSWFRIGLRDDLVVRILKVSTWVVHGAGAIKSATSMSRLKESDLEEIFLALSARDRHDDVNHVTTLGTRLCRFYVHHLLCTYDYYDGDYGEEEDPEGKTDAQVGTAVFSLVRKLGKWASGT